MAFIPNTWNPDDKSASVTLSSGDLVAVVPPSHGVRSKFAVYEGKHYWEMTGADLSGSVIGVAGASCPLSGGTDWWYGSPSLWGVYGYSGYRIGPSAVTTYASFFPANAVIGLALDMDLRTMYLSVNGTAGPVTSLGLSGPMYAYMTAGRYSATTATAKFGASALTYSAPAGFRTGLGFSGLLSGVVSDSAGDFAARRVRAYREDTGVLAGETVSNATTGAYQIPVVSTGAHTLVFSPAVGETSLNALILRGVVPE